MSYENPRTAIDTQSAQHLANLQNTLSSNLKVMGDRYRADQLAKNKKLNERAKENALMAKEAQKAEDNITDNVNKTTARLGLNQQPALNVIIGTVSELINANNSGKLSPEEIAINKQKISALKASPQAVSKLYSDMTQSALTISQDKEKHGTFGGLDKYGDPNIYRDLSTWSGLTGGSRELQVETLENGIDLDASVVINGNKYFASQLQRIGQENSELLTKVPDPRSDWESLTNSLFINKDLKDPSKDSFKKGVLEDPGEPKITEPDKDGNRYRITTRKTKKDFLINSARVDAKASIDILSPRKRAALWNNIFSSKTAAGELKDGVDPSDTSDPVFVKKLEEAWLERWFETKVGNEVEISRELIKEPKDTTTEETSEENNGKNFYDKVRKDPIGAWESASGGSGERLKMVKRNGNDIIIRPAGTDNSGKIIPEEQYNMSIPSQRKDFYNQLLKLSDVANGTSESARKYRAQFEEALSQGTAKKTKKIKEDKEKAKADADAKAKADAKATEEEIRNAEVYKGSVEGSVKYNKRGRRVG